MVALLLGPWLYPWVPRMPLYPVLGGNHAMVHDAYKHALYVAMFVFGFALVGRPGLWQSIDRLRWPALVLAALGAVVFIGLSSGAGQALPPGAWQRWVGRAGREAQAWGALLAALGFVQRHLNHDHRGRAYGVEVVFAHYIVHQTALIALAVWLQAYAAGRRAGGQLHHPGHGAGVWGDDRGGAPRPVAAPAVRVSGCIAQGRCGLAASHLSAIRWRISCTSAAQCAGRKAANSSLLKCSPSRSKARAR